MENLKERLFKIYFKTTEVLFYAFVFFTLSFGRAFSTLHIDTFLSPVFITEIFLLLNIPILIIKYKTLTKLPKVFLIIFIVYFTATLCYLSGGLLKNNMFALRDLVLCLYLLFLPIAFIYLNSLKSLKALLVIAVFSNIISLFSGRCLMLDTYPSETFRNFIINSKLFNFGLYYGIASSFIISFYDSIKSKLYKFLALIILSFNVLMFILIGLTSLWAAALALFLFLFLMLKGKFLKLLIFFVPVLILLSSIMFYLDFKCVSNSRNLTAVINELKGLRLFVAQDLTKIKIEEPAPEETAELVRASFAKKPKINLRRKKLALIKNEPVKIISREEVSQKNMNWRFGIWSQTLQFTKDSLWFGKGFGVYPVYKIGPSRQYPRTVCFDPWMVPTHNELITIFLKMGFFGLVLFLFINLYVFWRTFLFIDKCKLEFLSNFLIGLLGAFVFWHALALFFDVIDSPPTTIFLWIIMGLIFSVAQIDKNENRRVD